MFCVTGTVHAHGHRFCRNGAASVPGQTVPLFVLALVAAITCWLVSSALLPSGVMA